MTIIKRIGSGRGVLPLCGLVLAFPVLAGMPEDGSDPASAAADWQATVENLVAGHRSGRPRTEAERHGDLVNRAATDGTVPVIVRFKEAAPGAPLAEAAVQAGRATKRQTALNRLGLAAGRDRAGETIKDFSHMGGFALRADTSDVIDLLNNPDVLDVVEDVAYPPALLQSVPLVGALGGAFGSDTGLGQVVAILDTGVDKSHPFLTGKVIAEACYSSNDTANGIAALCPGGVTASTAAGSAANCAAAQWGSGCDHGTHVAGIVAGANASYSGVAKDARLIAIQVFSGFPSTSCGTTGAPCVMAYTSDIIKGLERVYALRTTYNIASSNLSLGGGRYSGNCDTDTTKPAIDKLRAAGIATVIASGNDGYTNAISAPACISSAISVGATCDAAGSYCAGADAVASYSNSATFVSLLAPGSAITSSVPGGGYGSWHGTSMATPHVAGAWAVIKQARPTASVDAVLAALKASGKRVTDARNGIAIPRIQPAAAITSLATAAPTAPALTSATGIATTGFQVNWTAITGATGYRLDVSTNSTLTTLVTGYNNLDVGNVTSRAVAGLKANTTYYARLRAYSTAGTSGNSKRLTVKTSK